MARVMRATRRAILPMSMKRIPDNESNTAVGTRSAFFDTLLPWRKSNPVKKMSMTKRTAGNNLIP